MVTVSPGNMIYEVIPASAHLANKILSYETSMIMIIIITKAND